MSAVSDQTKICRALAFGALPGAHPEELRILLFLANQRGYRWETYKRGWSQEDWAALLLIERHQFGRAMGRLVAFDIVLRAKYGHDYGQDSIRWSLHPRLIEALIDWFDQIWVGDNLPRLIAQGTNYEQYLENRHGIAKVNLPKRRPSPRRSSGGRQRPSSRRRLWAVSDDDQGRDQPLSEADY